MNFSNDLVVIALDAGGTCVRSSLRKLSSKATLCAKGSVRSDSLREQMKVFVLYALATHQAFRSHYPAGLQLFRVVYRY